MYKVYGKVATRAFRVLWALEEMGLDYTLIESSPQSDAIREVSSLGKIPVLEVDGTYLTDSVAIMTFLADRHGQLTYPAGSLDRARQDGFTERVNDEFDSPLWIATRHANLLPEKKRVPEIVPSASAEFGRNLARLAKAFDGPFLMGEQMTIADILLGHCLGWGMVMEFPIEEHVMKPYFKRLRDRPAYKAARAPK
ncbi:MAG: glutathione S-transferase family protein [Pseudomonadota bacterium]